MLTVWLKCTNPPPTWNIVTEALESPPVGEKLLAQQVRDKYCPQTEGGVTHGYLTQQPSVPVALPTPNIPPPPVSEQIVTVQQPGVVHTQESKWNWGWNTSWMTMYNPSMSPPQIPPCTLPPLLVSHLFPLYLPVHDCRLWRHSLILHQVSIIYCETISELYNISFKEHAITCYIYSAMPI